MDGAAGDTGLPSVAIVVPTLNEADFIPSCLDTIADQDYAHITTIFVADGGSVDATREIVAARAVDDPRIRLLDNPRRVPGAALNVALAEADADLLLPIGAHSILAPDYVRRCVEVMLETGARCVGGTLRALPKTRFGRAGVAVTTSKLGVGATWRWTDERRVVDTVPFGCYSVDDLRAIGGWDESMAWGEDPDLNMRLRRNGATIVCDPTIVFWYFPRERPADLWRQYSNYGYAKAMTLARRGRLPSPRPLAPAALVVALAAGIAAVATGRHRWIALPGAIWAGAITAASMQLAREPDVDARDCLGAFAICHVGYGLGFWKGAASAVTRFGSIRRRRGAAAPGEPGEDHDVAPRRPA